MHDVDHHQLRAGLRCDPEGAPDKGFGLRSAGDGDDDPLARLPRIGDVFVGAVFGERRVDLVGQPQQRQLAQRGEVTLPEVVGQCGVDTLGGVHVAVGQPAPQRFRCDVDQFDLVGGADDLVGHLLLLLDAGDLGDDVVEALQVLDVDRRDHGDARVEDLVDVLPPLRVSAARGVGVGQLVDEHDLRAALEDGVDVEFGEPGAAVVDVARRDDFDAVEQLCGLLAAVRFDHRCDDVGAAFQPTVSLAEHRVRLPDAGSCAEVDAQLSAFGALRRRTHMLIIHRLCISSLPDTSGRAPG